MYLFQWDHGRIYSYLSLPVPAEIHSQFCSHQISKLGLTALSEMFFGLVSLLLPLWVGTGWGQGGVTQCGGKAYFKILPHPVDPWDL